jgi:arginyl-tRNA synthetase
MPEVSAETPVLLRAELSCLDDPGELELIRKLAAFPSTVEGSARTHEPHRLAFYLYDLASTFHAQWTKGNELPHLRFIQPTDGKLTAARLALVRANQQVLATGLGILGVQAPDEMR